MIGLTRKRTRIGGVELDTSTASNSGSEDIDSEGRDVDFESEDEDSEVERTGPGDPGWRDWWDVMMERETDREQEMEQETDREQEMDRG